MHVCDSKSPSYSWDFLFNKNYKTERVVNLLPIWYCWIITPCNELKRETKFDQNTNLHVPFLTTFINLKTSKGEKASIFFPCKLNERWELMQKVHSIEIEKKITIQTRSQCYKTAEIPPVCFYWTVNLCRWSKKTSKLTSSVKMISPPGRGDSVL